MKKEYLLFLIFPISQIMMISGDYMAAGNGNPLAYLGLISSIVADIILLFVLIHGAKKEKIEKELEKVKYLNEIENTRNEMLEKRQQELYEMKADFERHIHQIMEDIESGNKENCDQKIEIFQEMLESTKPSIFCNHAVANAVLNEKEKVCRKLGFSIDIDIIIPRQLKIEPLHMCSLLSNLLDNAIEAVTELKMEERQISLRGGIRGNYLFVKVTNPTTKEHANRKRRKEHGYGTLILKDIAKKYDGEYTGKFDKGYYTATIITKVI